jgi:hypothetical protein
VGADGSSVEKTSLSSLASSQSSGGGSMLAQLIVILGRQSEIISVAGDNEGGNRDKDVSRWSRQWIGIIECASSD